MYTYCPSFLRMKTITVKANNHRYRLPLPSLKSAMPQSEHTPSPPGELEDGHAVGLRCEVMFLDERYDKKGEVEVVQRKGSKNDGDESSFSEYTIVSKRCFNLKKELEKNVLRIHSPHILKALAEVVHYYPEQPTRFNRPIEIEAPYKVLFHHLDELEKLCESIEDDVARLHLNLLLKFLDQQVGEETKAVKQLNANGFTDFNTLWTIFKPGELIIKGGKNPRLVRLEKVKCDENRNCGKYLEIYYLYTDFDGKRTGRASDSHRIYEKIEVPAPTEITALSWYPLKHYKGDVESLIQRLHARGERFLDIKEVNIVRYDGSFKYLKEPPYDWYSNNEDSFAGYWLPRTTNGRVVLDCNTCFEEFGTFKPTITHVLNPRDKEIQPRCTLPDWPLIDPILCPSFIYGYDPNGKVWGRFFIDQITDAQWKSDAFEFLILPSARKHVIRSLVNSHRFPEPDKVRDQGELKGKGLVILLHGAPGSGKTLTAETVAEHTKRVILSISSGSLGQRVYDIDYKFKELLKYATAWNAIVLIDEADVFLEARQGGAASRLEHNSIVAVFLRHLEYFQGIIFLTSNRIEGFDNAVKSRIHLLLGYNAPDLDSRRMLWKQMLGKIPPEEAAFDIEEVLAMVESYPFNGREISNAANTLRTLGREDGGKVTLEHFEMMKQVWSSFDAVQG
ncbi:P-loop containing nucleoside triphosphate hydrolase protein [Trichophaea hybrida]|nr:P-loop containing nucleoside triphosphate hydrolase protein [Trichophaea hybrida]